MSQVILLHPSKPTSFTPLVDYAAKVAYASRYRITVTGDDFYFKHPSADDPEQAYDGKLVYKTSDAPDLEYILYRAKANIDRYRPSSAPTITLTVEFLEYASVERTDPPLSIVRFPSISPAAQQNMLVSYESTNVRRLAANGPDFDLFTMYDDTGLTSEASQLLLASDLEKIYAFKKDTSEAYDFDTAPSTNINTGGSAYTFSVAKVYSANGWIILQTSDKRVYKWNPTDGATDIIGAAMDSDIVAVDEGRYVSWFSSSRTRRYDLVSGETLVAGDVLPGTLRGKKVQGTSLLPLATGLAPVYIYFIEGVLYGSVGGFARNALANLKAKYNPDGAITLVKIERVPYKDRNNTYITVRYQKGGKHVSRIAVVNQYRGRAWSVTDSDAVRDGTRSWTFDDSYVVDSLRTDGKIWLLFGGTTSRIMVIRDFEHKGEDDTTPFGSASVSLDYGQKGAMVNIPLEIVKPSVLNLPTDMSTVFGRFAHSQVANQAYARRVGLLDNPMTGAHITIGGFDASFAGFNLVSAKPKSFLATSAYAGELDPFRVSVFAPPATHSAKDFYALTRCEDKIIIGGDEVLLMHTLSSSPDAMKELKITTQLDAADTRDFMDATYVRTLSAGSYKATDRIVVGGYRKDMTPAFPTSGEENDTAFVTVIDFEGDSVLVGNDQGTLFQRGITFATPDIVGQSAPIPYGQNSTAVIIEYNGGSKRLMPINSTMINPQSDTDNIQIDSTTSVTLLESWDYDGERNYALFVTSKNRIYFSHSATFADIDNTDTGSTALSGVIDMKMVGAESVLALTADAVYRVDKSATAAVKLADLYPRTGGTLRKILPLNTGTASNGFDCYVWTYESASLSYFDRYTPNGLTTIMHASFDVQDCIPYDDGVFACGKGGMALVYFGNESPRRVKLDLMYL